MATKQRISSCLISMNPGIVENSLSSPKTHFGIYSTRHRNVPVLESYNGRRTEETLQSVGRFFTMSRRLHYRAKDVPFLRTVAPFSIKR